MSNLIGPENNQVPTNGMLGSMAFQDQNAVSILAGNISGQDTSFKAGPSGTAVWRDNIQSFVLKTVGAAYPSYGVTIGTFEGYKWSASDMNNAFVDFHIDHDILLGAALSPHVHFRPLSNAAGVVRWGFEFSTSKGHGQQTGMPASTTVYVDFTVAANNLGTHYVAEINGGIPTTNIEPDAVIHVRVFRDAAHANDTYTGEVWAWQSDLHYQVGRVGTINKAPGFYA